MWKHVVAGALAGVMGLGVQVSLTQALEVAALFSHSLVASVRGSIAPPALLNEWQRSGKNIQHVEAKEDMGSKRSRKDRDSGENQKNNHQIVEIENMSEPFTLKVYVPSGNPEATRIVEKMNWTGRGYIIPRADWVNVKDRADLAAVGIYILLGYEQDELDIERRIAYVGQTETLRSRLDNHDKDRDWWDTAVVFISTNEGLNRAHVTWLEWALLERAQKANRGVLKNDVSPKEPVLAESEKADVRGFFNEMLRLMPVMGVHFFEPSAAIKPSSAINTLSSSSRATQQSVSKKDQGVSNINKETEIADVFVVPAKPDGFQYAFIDAQAWWAVRVGSKYLPNLKWIAAYQVRPISAITHIAEIDRFELFGDDGKYKVFFKGPAKELARKIPLGNAPGAMQGPRYCSKARFDTAKTIAALLKQEPPQHQPLA